MHFTPHAQLIKLQLPIDSPVPILAWVPLKHQIHNPKNTALHIPQLPLRLNYKLLPSVLSIANPMDRASARLTW